MFGKFSEQLKKSTKPVNSFLALNAKTLEDLSQHQTELFTGMLSDSVKYLESVSVQTEMKGIVAANSAYAESMRERFASASKEAYSTLSEMQTKMTDVVKGSFDSATNEVAEEVKAVTKPVAKATKAAPKVVKKAAAPAAKTAEKTVEAVKEVATETKEVAKAPAEAAPKPTATPKKTTTRTRKTTTAAKKAPAKSTTTSSKSTS